MILCFTVDDVCYESTSTEDHLSRLLDFLGTQGVMATLFVVPLAQGIPLTERPGYVELLRRALREGHEVAQHGLEHDRFEVGIPPEMILALPHEGAARERLSRERAAIEGALQVDNIRQRLARGRAVLQDGVGSEVVGFRAPCLQVCDNLFHALEEEGYRYDSSRYLQPTGWDILNGVEHAAPRPITREDYWRVQYPGRLRVFPLTTEYTWYLTHQRYARTLDLAKHDASACLEAQIPFVPLSHVSPIQEGDADCGFAFYRQLFDYTREIADRNNESLQFVTLSQACERALADYPL